MKKFTSFELIDLRIHERLTKIACVAKIIYCNNRAKKRKNVANNPFSCAFLIAVIWLIFLIDYNEECIY